MLRTLIVIVLTAFTAGLIAESTLAIYDLLHGVQVALDTAIELAVCWAMVLCTAYATVVQVARGRW